MLCQSLTKSKFNLELNVNLKLNAIYSTVLLASHMCISYRYYINILFKCIFLIATLIVFTLFSFSSLVNVVYNYFYTVFMICVQFLEIFIFFPLYNDYG